MDENLLNNSIGNRGKNDENSQIKLIVICTISIVLTLFFVMFSSFFVSLFSGVLFVSLGLFLVVFVVEKEDVFSDFYFSKAFLLFMIIIFLLFVISSFLEQMV